MSKDELINRLRSELGVAEREFRLCETAQGKIKAQGKKQAFNKAIELAKQLD